MSDTALSYHPGPAPDYQRSDFIRAAHFQRFRYHQGAGDMWPLTWAEDGNIYAGAGDNRHSPMNVWRVTGEPDMSRPAYFDSDWVLDEVCNKPLDAANYRTNPRVDRERGLKPAGLIDLNGLLHMAVESHNYGEDPAFNRQTNIEGWIITSDDHGVTWNEAATDYQSFFSGRVASCHFLQYGQGGATPDGWLYAYFPGASDDGNSYWCNGDYVLLGRVDPGRVLERGAWQFLSGYSANGVPEWSDRDADAVPIFSYVRMTGENHVSYNAGLRRYIMGNFSFLDRWGNPLPYHQATWPLSIDRTQLTLFESPNPWGPWRLFHRDDNWGTYGDYQPVFPTKWMYEEGRVMFLVSSGSWDDYNFTVQRVDVDVDDRTLASS